MYRFSALFLCIFLSFGAMGQYRHLLHKSYKERFLFLDTTFFNNKVAYSDSVDFFAEVDKIERLARAEKDQELLLEAEFLRNEYYMVGRPANPKQFLRRMKALKKLADEKKIRHLQIRTRQKLGYFFFYRVQQLGPGFENYLQSYELMKDVQVSELPDKQELVYNIGKAYFMFAEMQKAREFLALAQAIPPSYKKRLPIDLTNTVALLYQRAHKYDSAEHYFRKGLQMAEAIADSAWIGIISGNIGYTYVDQKRYTEAIPLLETDVRLSLKSNELDNAVSALQDLATIYLELNQLPKSIALTRQAFALAYRTGYPDMYHGQLYLLRSKQQAQLGNYKAAYVFSDSSRILLDSAYVRTKKQQQVQAENKVALERYNTEMTKAQSEEKLRTLRTVAIVLTILLLAVIIVLIINQKRLVLKRKQQQLLVEKENIETELDEAVRQLNDFTQSIREKNQLIEQYSEEIKNYKSEAGGPGQESRRQALSQLLQSTLLTDEQWEDFTRVFDKVYSGFLQRLREKLPGISPADTRFIVLSKLNLTPKEMASMLGVKTDTVRLYRHRLRKKLHLSEEESIRQLVDDI